MSFRKDSRGASVHAPQEPAGAILAPGERLRNDRLEMVRALFLLVLAHAAGCAARYGATTVPAGTTEVAASVGGPVFGNLGMPLVLPLLHVGARRGLGERLDVGGGVHATALAFGVAGIDAGARVQLVRRPRLHLLAGALANGFVGLRDGALRVYPELGFHAATPLAGAFRLVGGAVALAQVDPPAGKPPVFAAPYVGAERALRGGLDAIGVTVGWISPWQDSTSVVDWMPGDRGALAVHVGYRRGIGR